MSSMLDYMQLCRLCLVKEKVNVPIFSEQSDVRQIYLKISACLPVKISRDDSLPKKICDNCFYKVDLLYQFWNTTVNAEKQLTEWLGNLGVDIKKASSSTSIQHSTPIESLVLKQENHDPPSEVQNVEQIQEFLPSTQIYRNYNQQFASSNVPNDNLNSSINNEPSTAKRRGRPPGSTKKKSPPATQTSTNTEDESMEEDSTLNEPDLQDSDESMEDGKRIAKEEQESDIEYEEQEVLEPTTFVGVTSETPCDTEQPGPSGLNKPATITASEAGVIVENPDIIEVYECEYCQKIFQTHYRAVRHTETHRPKKHACPVCNRKYPIKSQLIQHMETHNTEKKYSCDYCEKAFTTKKYWLIHTKRHTQGYSYKCGECSRGFISQYSLDLHVKFRHLGYRQECKICHKTFKDPGYFNIHVKSHDPSYVPTKRKKKTREIVCEVCAKILTSLSSYKAHMMLHRNEKPFMCSSCGEKFTKPSTLRVHNRIHLNIKPYSCNECGKCFRQSPSLIIHKRYHTGERPYECLICKRGFVSKSAMNLHCKSHN